MRFSAGLLLFRRDVTGIEVLIGHMGGPLWAGKDDRSWSIPKGEYVDEDPRAAALREFEEEMGSPPPPGPELDLGSIRQSSTKTVRIFAREADFDAEHAVSNTFSMQWPPKSGHWREFLEIDRAAWLSLNSARMKLIRAQVEFLDRLVAELGVPGA